MFKLVNKAKKNNKGFSLVELIVVILIIAIIAVALAPQVMKYVGQASDSTDANNIATIKSAVSTAYADMQSEGKSISATTTYYVRKDGISTAASGNYAEPASTDNLYPYVKEVMNGDFPEVKSTSGAVYVIDATTAGAVTVATTTGAYKAS